ncbi:uncharacterized protein LOC129588326 [Paramacrobiotus metropolitanus]|uniref:uncharacterized protein LOC129588326 n=1 Tax=Paramacrobiotus metropolitanus TaxID=2943436 RepID=UPI0024462764|nr:uncharacterized protein LOC129588326 [Paramacrobiotus metropolitanus]XP_055338474.1 uncharacterized protein LOC129588326 [Paramacrobiotus metropolitanus]
MSVWFESPAISVEEDCLDSQDAGDNASDVELPLEILEKILQLMPASHHPSLTSVSKRWQSIVAEPLLKREVIINSDHFDTAWKTHYQDLFVLKIFADMEPIVQAYEHILALWIMRFVGQHTRTLCLANELCNKAHLVWPRLRRLLSEQCPKLRKVIFQTGQIRLDVLCSMPATVEFVGLEECRVVKRHPVEGFTECVLAMKGHQRVSIDLRRISAGKVEEYLRSVHRNHRTDRKDSC